MTDAEIQSQITASITAGTIPKPAGTGFTTLYVVLFPGADTIAGPPGTGNNGTVGDSGAAFCAYHNSYERTTSPATYVVYAVIPDNANLWEPSGGCGAQTHTRYVAHFVVNTAQNGRGPNLNPPARATQPLCNPPNAGIGRLPTTDTAPTFDGHDFRLLDAFLWTGVPGNSRGGSCHPGDVPAGVWFTRYALELAANANNQLGPGYPNAPY